MVSKYNLLYVVYRTGQITVGRMMKTDGTVDFFVVLSGMSLSPTSKTFWPFLQDPLCCALPPWRSLSRTLNLFAVFKTLTYLTQQDGHSHRMSNKNDYKSVLHLLTLLLAVRLPHLQHAVLWLSSNLPILLVYNMFGGMILVHHGSCT